MSTASPFDPQIDRLNLSPRRVARWDNGVRTATENVRPTPFGQTRAAEIETSRRRAGQCADLDEHMTDGEIAYVLAVWNTIPHGGSCFATAFDAIAKGDLK